MPINWQNYSTMTEPLAGGDTYLVRNVSNLTASPSGTIQQVSHLALLASVRTGLIDVYNAVTDYGLSAAGTAAANNTAIANAINDATFYNKPLYIPAGQYNISVAINAAYSQLYMFGAGMDQTTFIQNTSNIPVINIGGNYQTIAHMAFWYTNQQTSAQTGAIAISALDLGWSTLDSLLVWKAAIGLGTPTNVDPSNHFFSNIINRIWCLGATISAIKITPGSTGNTGSVWSNLYLFGDGPGVQPISTEAPFHMTNCRGEIINRLNVEWYRLPVAAVEFRDSSAIVNGLHLEGNRPAGNNAAFIHCWGFITPVASDVSISKVDISAEFLTTWGATTKYGICRVEDNSILRIDGLKMEHYPASPVKDIPAIPLVYTSGSSGSSTQQTHILGHREPVAVITALEDINGFPNYTGLKQYNLSRRHWQEGPNDCVSGTSIPPWGTWKVGDKVYNTAPTAGGNIGWVCTTAGTVGTWKTFGAVAA